MERASDGYTSIYIAEGLVPGEHMKSKYAKYPRYAISSPDSIGRVMYV